MQDFANEHIVLWGDSLGKGVVWNAERARYGYAKLSAASIVERKLCCIIDNRSKFGCTAPMGMELIRQGLTSALTCDAAIIEYGGNDCNFNWAEISERPNEQHRPNTLPEQFRNTLCGMVEMLRSSCIRPILMTLPPINAERYFRFFVGDTLNASSITDWLGDVWQIYRYQEMYSLMIIDVARSLHVQLLDLRSRCLAMPNFIHDYICADGLHLNEQGQVFAGEQLSALALQKGYCK